MEREIDEKEIRSDRYSLRGRVYETIRERILRGEFKKNEVLKEVSLAKELGVSRTPLREALYQLELEGLVNIVPNKGAYVIGITDKDIHDIYQMRSRLEGLCARWATEKVTDEQLDTLEEICDLSEFYVTKERFEKILDLDNRFHEMLYQCADSRMLRHVLSQFHQYIEPLRQKSLSEMSRVEACTKEHRDILNAIRDKNADLADSLAHLHMTHAIENVEKKHLL